VKTHTRTQKKKKKKKKWIAVTGTVEFDFIYRHNYSHKSMDHLPFDWQTIAGRDSSHFDQDQGKNKQRLEFIKKGSSRIIKVDYNTKKKS
jgi:hypothetical protein